MWESQGFKTAPGQRNRQFVIGDHWVAHQSGQKTLPFWINQCPPKMASWLSLDTSCMYGLYRVQSNLLNYPVCPCVVEGSVKHLLRVECCKASDTMNSSSSSRHSRHYPGNHSSYYDKLNHHYIILVLFKHKPSHFSNSIDRLNIILTVPRCHWRSHEDSMLRWTAEVPQMHSRSYPLQ